MGRWVQKCHQAGDGCRNISHHPELLPCIPQPQHGPLGSPKTQRTPLPHPVVLGVCIPPPLLPRSSAVGEGSKIHPWGPHGAHHDQPLGDLLGAAVAQLPKVCPVILLAVQAPILLIVLVGQGGPALTAPAAATGTLLSPRPHCHPGAQPALADSTALWASCIPHFLHSCRATASICPNPQGDSR